MKNNKNYNVDILFIDGLEHRYLVEATTFLGYLLAIAPVLEENGYTYKVINLTTLKNYSNEGLIDELNKINFKAVGMSTNADNIQLVYKVIPTIKKRFPNIPIILGGPQATYSSNKILNETDCDVIVKHEGEYKLIQLLDYFIKKKGSLDYIKGISYKDTIGMIKETTPSIPIDINKLPTPKYEILVELKYWHIPDECLYDNFYDFLKKIKYFNNIFMTGRGCPYVCSFCVEGNNSSKFRLRNVTLVEKDLRHYLNILNVSYLLIGDDTFTINLKRVKEITEIFKKLRNEYWDFVWFAEGRVDRLSKEPEMLKLMVEAGLYKLQLGIESGNQKVLNTYNKKITLEQIEKVIKQSSSFKKLLLHGNLILGNPFETYKDFLNSIEYAKKLIKLSGYRMDFASGYLTPFVGTEIRENPDKFGIEIFDENFEHNSVSFTQITCKPNTISLENLQNQMTVTEGEFIKYYRDNIWNLPKQYIDEKWKFDILYGGGKSGIISRSWSQTVYSLLSIQKYYALFYQKGYTGSYKYKEKNDLLKLIPLRLWDLPYCETENKYSFTSLTGTKIVIRDSDKFLYEAAVGNSTITEILELDCSPFALTEESIKYAITFYLLMEQNFAIIFKDY